MSPRTSWKGLIRLEMVSLPITVGKATDVKRETGIKQLCGTHKVPVDRSERCTIEGCTLDHKVRGVETAPGTWKAFSEGEYSAIEETTNSDTLDVIGVRNLSDLPMDFSMGTYYIRADSKIKGSDQPLAILSLALHKGDLGLVVKWCNSTTQKLCVIHIQQNTGVVLMKHIPMLAELRMADAVEKAHQQAEVSADQVEAMSALLETVKTTVDFDYEIIRDEGLALREEAVSKILDGKVPEKSDNEPIKMATEDIMKSIQASIDAKKEVKV